MSGLPDDSIRHARPGFSMPVWIAVFAGCLALIEILRFVFGVGEFASGAIGFAVLFGLGFVEVRRERRAMPGGGEGGTLIYVRFDEQEEAYRPVMASKNGDVYRLPGSAPEGEVWITPPGSIVEIENRDGDLVAARTL